MYTNSIRLQNIKSGTVSVNDANLTEFEYLAINCHTTNVADGHARQTQTSTQAKIIDDLPAIFRESEQRSVDDLEYDAHCSFFRMLGQYSYPAESKDRIFACYASSVAMEILARALAVEISKVGLIHPTFDNIPDLLKGMQLDLIPIEEIDFHEGERFEDIVNGLGAVFVTTPNNPTGAVISEERLGYLATVCARFGVILCLDTSFRGFDPRAQFDHYAVLNESGCRWVVIEDTGKLWPTLDLKIGWLVVSENIGLPIGKIYSDILLGVSPMILTLVRRFAEDAAAGGLIDLQRFIAKNRKLVRNMLKGIDGVSFASGEVYGSVERIFLRDISSVDLWAKLVDAEVYALPCRKFHWARPEDGNNSLRIALARDTKNLAFAVSRIRTVLRSF